MASIEPTHGAFVARPSLGQRFWSAMGYGMSGYGDMIDWRTNEALDKEFAPGALVTDSIIHVGFVDRLRLLVSGRARLEVSTKTDVLVKRSVSRSAFGILPPWSA